jgi:hypothetical protein
MILCASILVLPTLAKGQAAASFEVSFPGPLPSPGPDPEGWLTGAGTNTVVPFGPITGGTSGFPTDNNQWAIVNSAGSLGYLSPPPAGVPPTLPLPAGHSARIRFPLFLPAAPLTIRFNWTYVSLECANSAPFNDFFTVDLTNAAGARLANILYRDTFSVGYVSPAVTPNETGTIPPTFCGTGGREVAPAGQPKLTTFTVPSQLATGQTVFFEINLGDVNDVSFSGYAWIDNLRLTGGGPGVLSLNLSQPLGAGSFRLVDTNLATGVETFNIVSLEPAPGGVGTGPYLGLWTANVNNLLAQVQMPVGAQPFHILPGGPIYTFGPLSGIPAGLQVQMVVFEWNGSVLGRVSPVAALTTQ